MCLFTHKQLLACDSSDLPNDSSLAPAPFIALLLGQLKGKRVAYSTSQQLRVYTCVFVVVVCVYLCVFNGIQINSTLQHYTAHSCKVA